MPEKGYRSSMNGALVRERNLFLAGPVVAFKRAAVEGYPHEYVSPNVSRFGYQPDDFLEGRVSYADIIHPEDKARVVAEERAHVAAGSPHYEQEYRIRTADGRAVWVQVYTVVGRDRSGALTHFDGYALDITARKRTELALEESEARHRIIAEQTGQLIYDWRMDTGAIHWAGAIEEITGYSPAELERADILAWEEAIHPDDRARAMESLEAAVESGERYTAEYRFRRRDGDYVVLEDNGVFLKDDEGRAVRMLGTMKDIAERRRAEEDKRRSEAEMQHAQKLESLGVLAGGIAHDFNNLLVAILGNVDMALLDMPALNAARENLLAVRSAARRAADLTKQLLAYAGKARFRIEPVRLGELVAEMARMIEVSLSKKAVLSLDLDPGLPEAEADPAQLRQVVMNLIINASEAIGDGSGAITVSTAAWEVGDSAPADGWHPERPAPGTYVSLQVSDTGCGMDRETVARIFDPFFSTKFAGRGLGLAAVLGIVRSHKGAIRVTSEPGRGTSFLVLLPRSSARAPERDTPVHREPSCLQGSGLVLFVDDEESVRSMGQRMLERLGFSVLLAADGREALRIFEARGAEIACAVLDLSMPEMDGTETFHAMKRLAPDVPVVLSSGFGEQEVRSRFAGLGLAGFIQKPYEIAGLGQALLSALAESARRPPVKSPA